MTTTTTTMTASSSGNKNGKPFTCIQLIVYQTINFALQTLERQSHNSIAVF
jgi:hypothetical protein